MIVGPQAGPIWSSHPQSPVCSNGANSNRKSSCLRSGGTCVFHCPTATSRNSWPNAGFRSITSRSGGGCSAMRRRWSGACGNGSMYQQARRQAGRPPPSVVIMDGQSVKTTERGGIRGFDAHKRVKGRKRHILVDTFGLLIACRVEPADISDRKAAALLLGGLRPLFPNIRTVIADAGHQSRKLARPPAGAKTAGSCRSSNAGSARSRSQASPGLWSAASLGLAAIDD